MKRTEILTFLILVMIASPVLANVDSAKNRGPKLASKTFGGIKTSEGKMIKLYQGSYALVIGNGDYQKGWDPILGAVQDVKEVAKALSNRGFNVTLKTNLTKKEFSLVLNEFSVKYGKDEGNQLLIYFAGHGYTRKMANDENLGYLIMVDTPPPEKDLIGFSIKAVDMQTMITQAMMMQARHVLFMFDSCFSGTLLSMRDRIVPKLISDSVKYPVRQFITAGRANEPVPDHSVFKQVFLDLLEGRDKEPIPDGYITGEELGLYLKTKVSQYNPAQNPQYGKIKDSKLDKGDFVFIPGKRDRSIDERNKKEPEDHNTPMVMLSNTDTGKKFTPQNDLGKVILFRDPTTYPQDEARVLEVTLIDQQPDELLFDLEYYLPSNIDGNVQIGIYPDRISWSSFIMYAFPGRHKTSIEVGLSDKAKPKEQSTKLRIIMDLYQGNRYIRQIYKKVILFEKTWVR